MSNSVISVNDESFISEVTNCKEIVLVDFWAEWCGPCKALMPHIERLAQEKEGKIKVCKFNIDEGTEIPSKYGIQSIPTLILFGYGEEIARKIGAISDLASWINNATQEK